MSRHATARKSPFTVEVIEGQVVVAANGDPSILEIVGSATVSANGDFAQIKLDQWIRWARRSRLAAFKRIAGTVRDCTEGILAYVRSGLSNGRTEGLNGKARTITRRSYGFHSSSGLIALLMLCCSGIHLDPVQLQPGSTH